uniref:PawS-like protein 1b n=1 Tax=Dahlia pinnata TaxID=101596 RepID=A0A1V0JB66_DAHPI|nr:PawS-like protein 1b [Dahlia pinnata]
MIKVSVAATILALAATLAFAKASAYKTTITTTITNDNGLFPYGPDSLKDNGLFPYGPDSLKDNGLFPYGPDSLIRVNPKLGSTEKCRISVHLEACRMHLTQNGGQLEQCCQELKKVDDRCKCKAIQQVFDQARQQGQGQGQGQGQLMLQKKAQMLPNACMFKFHQCPIMV